MPEAARIGLLIAAILFAAFVLLKSRLSLMGRRQSQEAWARLREAKNAAREAGTDQKAKAKALRRAAHIALDELRRPNLAASFAVRADRVDPEDGSSVSTLARALRRASRHRSLEKLLWRRLAASEGAVYDRAFEELVSLYEGPLRRPFQAEAMRRLRGASRERGPGPV